MHTNFDSVKEGMGDLICSKLSWKRRGYCRKLLLLLRVCLRGLDFIPGWIRHFPARNWRLMWRKRLRFPILSTLTAEGLSEKLRFARVPERALWMDVIALGADAYDHRGFGAPWWQWMPWEKGLVSLMAGHYGLERFFVPYMSEQIRRHFPKIDCVEEKEVFLGKIL